MLSKLFRVAALGLIAFGALIHNANATTQVVTFNLLNASTTLGTPFSAGDTLLVNTLVTTETGALSQSVTFTVGAGVTSFTGNAAWEVSTPGPRLSGVNIDLFSSSNTLVATDTFLGVLGGFALSTFDNPIGPGTYKLIATGTGVRESSLDVSLSFIGTPVPEPETCAMLLAGLGLLGFVTMRKIRD